MKKLFLSLILCMFLISFVSSAEFDNWKTYDSETKEVTITNWFNLGETIAKVQLLTPLNNIVLEGYNEVARFKVSAYTDYNEGIKEIELFNIKNNMAKFSREIDVKVLTYEDEVVNTYAFPCYTLSNGTSNCIINGTITQKKEVWKKLTPADFKKNDELIVALFTNVEEGDYVEWIPNLFGARVEEWATWAGEGTFIFNMDTVPAPSTSTGDGPGLTGTKIVIGSNDLKVWGITKMSASTYTQAFIHNVSFNSGRIANGTFSGDVITFSTPITLLANKTYWIGGNRTDGATYNMKYYDGAARSATNESVPAGFNFTLTHRFNPGGLEYVGYAGFANLLINNIPETAINVLLSSPPNNSNIATTSLDFKCNITSTAQNISSITLNVTGPSTWTQTITGLSTTSYNATFTNTTLADGTYNWNCIGYGSAGVNGSSAIWNFYKDTLSPLITITYPTSTNYNINVSELNWSIFHPIGNLSACWYSLNGGVTNNTITCGNNASGLTSNQGSNTWTVWVNDTVNNIGTSNVTFNKDTIYPTIIINNPIAGSTYNYSNLILNITTSDTNLGVCKYSLNGATNITYTCNITQNITGIEGTNTLFAYVNDTYGNTNQSNITFKVDIASPIITITSPNGVYYSEGVSLNYSVIDTTRDACWYSLNGGSNITLPNCANTTLNLRVGNNSVRVYANDSFGNTGNSSLAQSYLYPTLALCNSTINKVFMNITFKDEISDMSINATATASSTYYLGTDSTLTRVLSFTNTSQNPSYALCGSPNYTTIQSSFSYNGLSTGYPTRYFTSNDTLTNVTTNKTIYLLAAADGVYQPIVIVNSAGSAISGATVSAFYGTLGIVDVRTTDSNGQVTLWLDPNKAYVITASATGYPSAVQTINPTTTSITIQLGSTSTYPVNLTTPSTEGIKYTILPSNGTLYNETAYDFTFIVNSSSVTIDSFGFNLYNSTNSIVATVSSIANGGTVTTNYNVLNNTKMTLRGYYIVNGTSNPVSKSWSVINSQDTQYSIMFLKNRIVTYLDSGFFGLTRGFGLNIFCFIIIFIIVGTFSWKYGISNEIIISVMTLFLVWLFEFGMGLIYVGAAVPLTFWVAIIVVVLLIKEGLKVV